MYKRWYDQHEKLSGHLRMMQEMNLDERDRLIQGIAGILKGYDIGLSFDEVLQFPLDLPRRRWYDRDPYMWLIMNGLKAAEPKVIAEVEEYIENEIGV